MNTDKIRLKAALLDLGKADYENIRTELIGSLGYDQFREIQNEVFKEIGTIGFDKKHFPLNYNSQAWKEFGSA